MDTRTRWALGVVIAIIAAAVAGSAQAGSPPLVERDALGRRTGIIETRPDGGAVVRDAMGRRRETIEPSAQGWVRRDPNGRRLGRLSAAGSAMPRGTPFARWWQRATAPRGSPAPPSPMKPLTWFWLAEPAQRCCPTELSPYCGKKDDFQYSQRLGARRTQLWPASWNVGLEISSKPSYPRVGLR
jgi:hypothetical protein